MSTSAPTQTVRRCTGAARISRRRRLGAERQRELRERRRAAGVPEPDALDRAIVDSLRDIFTRSENGLTRPIEPVTILALATQYLQAKARKSAAPDGPISYDGGAVADAMRQRLLVKPAPPTLKQSVTV